MLGARRTLRTRHSKASTIKTMSRSLVAQKSRPTSSADCATLSSGLARTIGKSESRSTTASRASAQIVSPGLNIDAIFIECRGGPFRWFPGFGLGILFGANVPPMRPRVAFSHFLAYMCVNGEMELPYAAPEKAGFGAVDPVKALKGYFTIMDLWNASNAEARSILGAPSVSTFFAWKRGEAARPPEDTLRRIGYVAGIFKALQILYSDRSLADRWICSPNRAFGGQAPLERMAAGDMTDLAAVRAYLDSARAPWS